MAVSRHGGEEVDDRGPAAELHPLRRHPQDRVVPQQFGQLVDKAQLDFTRQRVQAGAQPQKTAYDAMKASSSASLSY
ncbi:hypothetical protein [Kribbella catacumbae]|uniref:hypothetical protein n=1 Tax=Kribbella catacumbae TaxID=460086 RepID=UPI000399B5B2|nr:hypothetical protein [Kribbella catacumbae]